jgi:uncharacterized membrane protein YphA (DoxX/SURF4 family)
MPTERSRLASWSSSKPEFVSRILLGLILIAGGVNNFRAVNPVPNPTPEGDRFLAFLQETGYLLQTVAITEVGVGILLLSGYFLPLALVVLAPVMLNIFLFHVFARFAGIGTAPLAAVFYFHLVYVHRRHFSDVLSP